MLVVVTRMQARGLSAAREALGLTGTVLRDLPPGFQGGRLRVDRRLALWTITGWTDAASLAGFREAHRPVAARGPELATALESTGWQQDDPRLPSWREVPRRWPAVVPPALGLSRSVRPSRAVAPAV
jgi:hypothetical protein